MSLPQDDDKLARLDVVGQCAHQAPDSRMGASEFLERGSFGHNGATVASPDLAHSIDDDVQESDIAAEDWLEATQALGFALGTGSSS